MIKTSIVADSVHLSLVRSLFNEAKKYDDVIDFTLGDPDIRFCGYSQSVYFDCRYIWA